jgi:ubiquinone/menaquinone biosynthesis C-methylase UbiE
MISRSDDYVEYCRETAKRAHDLHDLALRGRKLKHLTERIHEQIAEAVELGPGDDVVDIGCGDGTLLRLAQERDVHSALGLLATEEEVSLARRAGLNVRQGLTHQLPIADESASVVVCNNVLLVVPRERIPASLSEICRIARPEARIFVGEIPAGAQRDPTPQFSTRKELLSHLLHKQGVRPWLGMLRRMGWWRLTGQPAVIRTGTAVSFFAAPKEFTSLAKEARLEVVRYWQCDHYKARNNYLLRKLG